MKIPNFDTAPKEKAYSGYGKAMLSKMGWSEGDGLGKHRQGMSEALKVKKRELQQGLGADEALRYKWEEKWWEGHFESAADKFAKAVAAHADSDSGSDSDSDSEDDETARNLAACAVDANGNALVTVGTAKGRDGILYSGKKSDLDLAKDLAKDSWGNWGRAKGKLARIAAMEQEQLEKYGIQVGAANEKADESGKSARAGKDDGKRKREEKSAADEPSTPENAEEPVLTGEAYEGLPSESTKSRTWWVNAKFQWGGLVGSAREKSADVPKSAKRGFTEDDQERLFHSAHDGKVERGAKRGLGGKGVIKTEHTGVKQKFSEEGELLGGGIDGKKDAKKSREKSREKSPEKEKKEKKAKKEKKEKSGKKEKKEKKEKRR
jgi:hypothetical protein